MATDIESFIGNMLKKGNAASKKANADVVYTATFMKGNSKQKVMIDMHVKNIRKQVNALIPIENPEKIKIDLNFKDGAFIDTGICDLTSKHEQPVMQGGFKGFGEAEINQMVDQRLQERQRIMDFDQMKQQLEEMNIEREELEKYVEQLEKRHLEMEEELEGKKNIRYYAGMLGDILESFGISKERLKKPLVELMGISETESRQIPNNSDQSGIVEESLSEEQRKRQEIINLICDYLKTTSNKTLTEIFSIFSEIEKNNTLAIEISQYIMNRKNH